MSICKVLTCNLTDELNRLIKLDYHCAAVSKRSGGAGVRKHRKTSVLWLYLYIH
jgi:hypothetical protein